MMNPPTDNNEGSRAKEEKAELSGDAPNEDRIDERTMTDRMRTLQLASNRGAMASSSSSSDHHRRPFDDLGPACDPLEFDPPKVERGRRGDVVCYNPTTRQREVLHNVLFRNSHHYDNDDEIVHTTNADNNNNNNVTLQHAYWPMPHKIPIQTNMGHVEVCLVLERNHHSQRQADNDDECDDDDDIVYRLTNERVAVKVNYGDRLHRRRQHSEDPLREISAMQLLMASGGGEGGGCDDNNDNTAHHHHHHPNVMDCRQVLFDGKNLNVVMRYCDSGDLFDLIFNNDNGPSYQPDNNNHSSADSSSSSHQPGMMTESQARYWFRQLIAGLQHLHSCGICHRDLSPENVMFDGDRRHLIIIDFGMCLRVPHMMTTTTTTTDDVDDNDKKVGGATTTTTTATNVATTRGTTKRCLIKPQRACGKLPYMSPEIYKMRDNFDGPAIDVFGTGTILFCMLTGTVSYQRPHNSDPQFYWMTHGLETLLTQWGIKLSQEAIHLLQGMLEIDPRLRLTLDEVANHPWMTSCEPLPPRPDNEAPVTSQPSTEPDKETASTKDQQEAVEKSDKETVDSRSDQKETAETDGMAGAGKETAATATATAGTSSNAAETDGASKEGREDDSLASRKEDKKPARGWLFGKRGDR